MADYEAPTPTIAVNVADPSVASLRIITLAHGSNRENDLFLSVPLACTIGELKDRLTQILSGNPPAQQQRLIYLGRPLLDNSATLRTVLRLQGAEQTTHSLHLVIRPDATSVPTSTSTSAVTASAAPPSQPGQAREPQTRETPPLPQLPHVLQNGMTPAQFAQHQASIMQQHMAIHRQHLANLHHNIPHGNIGNIHQLHGLPPGFQHQVQTPAQPAAQGSTLNEINNQDHNSAIPSAPVTNISPTQQPGMTTRVQESIGPNGEQIRIVTNTSIPTGHDELRHALQANPVERSASAPGTAERSSTPGPPPMYRTSRNPMMPMNTIPFPHRQVQLPRAPLQTLPVGGLNATTTNPTVWLLSSPNGPQALLFAPGHGFFSTTPSAQPNTQNTQTDSVTNARQAQQQPVTGRPDPTAVPRQDQQAQANNVNQAQPGGELVLRPQDRPQDRPQPAPAINPLLRMQNGDGGELAAFVIQRGWLFLRLYMFIFVLSESGTWRRIILLGIATLVCFLPRQNPLIDAFNAARRHFDNLVGPPQPIVQPAPPANQGRRVENRGVAGEADAGNAPANTQQNNGRPGNTTMLTPEENARRLLREHQGRNQSFIRGLLQPVEQAVALFLASLIPGVGERHVRAREEARQLIANEEERRRVAAEQQQQTSSPVADGDQTSSVGNTHNEPEESKQEPLQSLSAASSSATPAASSTGVDTSHAESGSSSGEGLRQRHDTDQPPPNLVADW